MPHLHRLDIIFFSSIKINCYNHCNFMLANLTGCKTVGNGRNDNFFLCIQILCEIDGSKANKMNMYELDLLLLLKLLSLFFFFFYDNWIINHCTTLPLSIKSNLWLELVQYVISDTFSVHFLFCLKQFRFQIPIKIDFGIQNE